MPTLEPLLPRPEQRNIQGSLVALSDYVLGLACLGEVERRASLYPLTLIGRTWLFSTFCPPSCPQLTSALAAAAAGLPEKAREHFETAHREARTIPIRLLQPTVLYWYGRSIVEGIAAGDPERGRAMVTSALEDFRALGVVPYARLAEAFVYVFSSSVAPQSPKPGML